MNLKTFLLVGQSFSAGRSGRSPYEMRKESQLPRFGHSARYAPPEEAPARNLVQEDWLDERPKPQQTVTESQGHETPAVQPVLKQAAPGPAAASLIPPAPAPAPRQRRGLLWWLSFGLLGRPRKGERLVQSELGLENVRVVRNDLEDSDLEVVVIRKKKAPRPIFSTTVTNPSQNGGWNHLSAKLFDLGQNQR